MDIYQLLPLLKGWRREIRQIPNINVNVGEEKTLAEASESGWIVASTIWYAGDPYAIFGIIYHDAATGDRHELIANPRGLYEMGSVGVGLLHGARLTKYDDTNNIYCVMLSPERPIPFFASESYKLKFAFKPLYMNCTIYMFGYEVVFITDRDLFIESLREVLGSYQFVGGEHGRY